MKRYVYNGIRFSVLVTKNVSLVVYSVQRNPYSYCSLEILKTNTRRVIVSYNSYYTRGYDSLEKAYRQYKLLKTEQFKLHDMYQ